MASVSVHYHEHAERCDQVSLSVREDIKDPPGSLSGSLHNRLSPGKSMEWSPRTLMTKFQRRQDELLSNQPETTKMSRRSKSLRDVLSRLDETLAEGKQKLSDIPDGLERPEGSSRPLRSILHHSSRLGKSCTDLSCDIGSMSSERKKRRASARHRIFDQYLAIPRNEATETLNKEIMALTSTTESPTSVASTVNNALSVEGNREELLHAPSVREDTKNTKGTESTALKPHSPQPTTSAVKEKSPESQASSQDLHQLVQPIRGSSRDTKSRLSHCLTDHRFLRRQPAHDLLPDCPFDDDFQTLEKKNSQRSLGISDADDEDSIMPSAAQSNFDMSELTDDLELSLAGLDSVAVSEGSLLQLNIGDPASVDVLSVAGSKKKDESAACGNDENGGETVTYRFEDYELYLDQTAETEASGDSESASSDDITLTPSLADLLCVEDLAPLSSLGEGNGTAFSKHVCYIVD